MHRNAEIIFILLGVGNQCNIFIILKVMTLMNSMHDGRGFFVQLRIIRPINLKLHSNRLSRRIRNILQYAKLNKKFSLFQMISNLSKYVSQ